MDAVSIAALATDPSQTRTQQAVQFAVLKKALDIEAKGTVQLVQAISNVIQNNPPHLGNGIDTFV